MKNHMPQHGRDTFTVEHLRLHINGSEIAVENTAPFLVRGKYYYEPEIGGNIWDEPNSLEWWEWQTLYAYEDVLMIGPGGVVLTITPACDLLELLSEAQLDQLFMALKQAKQNSL